MQKLPESPDGQRIRKEKEPSQQKKESRLLSAVTSGVTAPTSSLLVAEGAMHPSLDDTLANFSTSSSRLFLLTIHDKNTE